MLLNTACGLLNGRDTGSHYFSLIFGEIPTYYIAFQAKKSFESFLKKKGFTLYSQQERVHKDYNGKAYIFRELTIYKDVDTVIVLEGEIGIEGVSVNLYSFVDRKNELKDYIYVPKKTVPEPTDAPFYMVLESDMGQLYVEEFDANFSFEDFDLKRNYGKDFIKHHKTILKALSEESTGLYLFHGLPGCGKTTYLKYLCSELRDHKVIFIPSNVYQNIDSPKFIKVLMQNPESIFLLEDAERLLKSREDGENPLISTLLNLTDGIMGSAFKLRTILTFNCDRSKIDKALLRKGRLKYEYQFDKLSISDSQSLLDHLKIKHKATESMSLAEIYNFDKDNNAK